LRSWPHFGPRCRHYRKPSGTIRLHGHGKLIEFISQLVGTTLLAAEFRLATTEKFGMAFPSETPPTL
jgi:hypothetical protein